VCLGKSLSLLTHLTFELFTAQANASCEPHALEGSPHNRNLKAKAAAHLYTKATVAKERYSCRTRNVNSLLPPLHETAPTSVHPRIGDGILFDQRLFHRGNVQARAVH